MSGRHRLADPMDARYPLDDPPTVQMWSIVPPQWPPIDPDVPGEHDGYALHLLRVLDGLWRL